MATAIANNRGLFRNKWFFLYFSSAAVSKIGDQIYKLAIPWFVLETTGSVAMMSLMWVVEILPMVVLGPFLGVFIDRGNRRRIMLLSDFARTVLVVLIPVLFWIGILKLWMLFAIGFLLSIFSLCFDLVADFGLLPQLVRDDQLTAANSAYRGMDNLTRMGGPAIAGALIALFGTTNAILIDAVSFLLTWIVIYFIPVNFRTEGDNAPKQLTVGSIFADVKEGFVFIIKTQILWVLALVGCFINLGMGALYTVMTYYLGSEMQMSSTVVGSVYGVMGAMMFLGSLLAPYLAKKIQMGQAITVCVLGSFLGAVLLASSGDWRIVIAGYAVMMLSVNMVNIYTFTVRQREIPNRLMGRVNSAYRMILTVSFPVSAAILGGLASAFNGRTAFIGSALMMMIVVFLILFSQVPKYREHREGAEAQVKAG
jgi:MFS family permease